MNTNIRLTGVLDAILDEAVKLGFARTKTEALILGVYELEHRYGLLERWEEEQDAKRASEIMEGIKKGKIRTYSKAEILKKLKE